MATLSKGRTFVGGETVTAQKLNELVDGASITNLTNADIAANAAIALTKLAAVTAGSVVLGNASNVPTATALSGDVTVSSTGVTAIGAGVIVNADVSASAAIAGTKVAPDFGSQAVVTTGTLGAGATTLAGALTLGNNNIVAGTGAGVKIGTATTQKLGFFDATPVVQPAAAAQAAAAAQTQDSLTDSTGGSASTTLAAITAGAAYDQADLTAIKNAIASLAAQLAKVRTDVTNIKTLQDATRTALVNLGLIKGAA
jgi:hypothetical protein